MIPRVSMVTLHEQSRQMSRTVLTSYEINELCVTPSVSRCEQHLNLMCAETTLLTAAKCLIHCLSLLLGCRAVSESARGIQSYGKIQLQHDSSRI